MIPLNRVTRQLAHKHILNPLRANPTKWPNTLKQCVGKLSTNCFSVFGHFVKLALKGLRLDWNIFKYSKFNFNWIRYPAYIYLFKVNSRNTRKMSEICSKLIIKTPAPCLRAISTILQSNFIEITLWHGTGVFIVNSEHISHIFLVLLLLILSKQMLAEYYL